MSLKRFYSKLDKKNKWINVLAEIDFSNARPYFSLTYSDTNSCGPNPELIAKEFPELAAFTKWHLCDISGVPMHYCANAEYWAGFEGLVRWGEKASNPVNRLYGEFPANRDYFNSTIKFGAVDADKVVDPWNAGTREELREILHSRIPQLYAQFKEDMISIYGDKIVFSS